MKKDVVFEDMPRDNIRSWRQNARITVDGRNATKVTYREILFKDGQTRKIEKTDMQEFQL